MVDAFRSTFRAVPGGIKRRTVGALDVSLHADLGFAVKGVCFGFCRFSLASLKLAEHCLDYQSVLGESIRFVVKPYTFQLHLRVSVELMS
jgi:hypothetical protein